LSWQFVSDVEPEEGKLTASFDGRSVTYGFGELDALVPAYAASIHKSQGSEYPAVVIPVMTQHYAMLQRHPRQAACRPGWPEEGRRHCGAQRLGPAAVVEAAGVAAFQPVPLAAHWHGRLSHCGNRIRPSIGLMLPTERSRALRNVVKKSLD
jgi:hypothetical protein